MDVQEHEMVPLLSGRHRPRAQDRIQMTFVCRSPMRTDCKEKILVALSTSMIVAEMVLTIVEAVELDRESTDFRLATVSLLSLLFFLLYLVLGVLGECAHDLIVYCLYTLVFIIYCILHYSLSTEGVMEKHKLLRLARLIIVVIFGLVTCGFSGFIARDYKHRRKLNMCLCGAGTPYQDLLVKGLMTLSAFKIDLLCMAILAALAVDSEALMEDTLGWGQLIVGIVSAIIWFILGILYLYTGWKRVVWIVFAFSWCGPAYVIYILAMVGVHWSELEYIKIVRGLIIFVSILCLIIRFTVCGLTVYVYRKRNQG